MYAILNLILLFTLVAIFVYSIGVDFIGLIFVIVYVGAIATLFLFIVMMLGGEEIDTNSPLANSTIPELINFSNAKFMKCIVVGLRITNKFLLDLALMFGFGLIVLEMLSVSSAGNFNSWLDWISLTYESTFLNTSFIYGISFYNYWYLPLLIAGIILLIAMLGSIVLTTRLLGLIGGNTSQNKAMAVKKQQPVVDSSTRADRDRVNRQVYKHSFNQIDSGLRFLIPETLWSVFILLLTFGIFYYFPVLEPLRKPITEVLFLIWLAGVGLIARYVGSIISKRERDFLDKKEDEYQQWHREQKEEAQRQTTKAEIQKDRTKKNSSL